MKTSEMIKSNYIRSEDLRGQPPLVLTISDVSQEDIGGDERYVLWFSESQKGLVLNVTKIRQLEAAYGPETEFWAGHRIKVKHDPGVMFAGQARGGLVIVCSNLASAPPHQPQPASPPPAQPATIRQQADAATAEFDDDIPF